MSTENHPNFHAVKFATGVIASFYASLRGPANAEIVTDEMHAENLAFVEKMEKMVDDRIDALMRR